jgi:hypothetical protein
MKWILLLQLLAASVDTGTAQVSATANTLTANTLIRVKPLEVTRLLISIGARCVMFMYEDSSMVMRTDTYSDSVCVRYYNKFPAKYRKNVGYWQKRADMICILRDGMPLDQKCNYTLITNTIKSFPQGWPQTKMYTDEPPAPAWTRCTPYVMACAAPTTIFDFEEQYKARYITDAYGCSDTQAVGTDGRGRGACEWAGWISSLRGFPGRWETGDNLIFFYRSP